MQRHPYVNYELNSIQLKLLISLLENLMLKLTPKN